MKLKVTRHATQRFRERYKYDAKVSDILEIVSKVRLNEGSGSQRIELEYRGRTIKLIVESSKIITIF